MNAVRACGSGKEGQKTHFRESRSSLLLFRLFISVSGRVKKV